MICSTYHAAGNNHIASIYLYFSGPARARYGERCYYGWLNFCSTRCTEWWMSRQKQVRDGVNGRGKGDLWQRRSAHWYSVWTGR